MQARLDKKLTQAQLAQVTQGFSVVPFFPEEWYPSGSFAKKKIQKSKIKDEIEICSDNCLVLTLCLSLSR
jgi:hypothetical protein